MKTSDQEKDLSWIDELAEQEYVVIDDFFETSELKDILAFFQEQIEADKLKKAGIGSVNYTVAEEIRGDFIYWLEEQRDSDFSVFFNKIKALTYSLNRYCYLSISSNEFHLALYPKGTFYHKHLDQFKERNNRLISVVFYLNENWQPGDGGELKIYRPEKEIIVEPIFNRLVLFKSDVVEHEVLLTHTNRKSVTGWLLYQPVGLGYLTT